jgi:hypothetical protein
VDTVAVAALVARENVGAVIVSPMATVRERPPPVPEIVNVEFPAAAFDEAESSL